MVFLISGSLVLTFVPWNHEATTIEGEFVLGQALDLLCLPSLEKWTLHWRLFPLNTRISFIESSSFDLKPLETVISPIEFTTCFAAYLPSRSYN